MFNAQYECGNLQNIQKFPALRLTLVKVILRFLALNINYSKVYNKLFDQKAMVAFLKYET